MTKTSLFARINPLNWFNRRNKSISTFSLRKEGKEDFVDVYNNGKLSHSVPVVLFTKTDSLNLDIIKEKMNIL